MKKNHTKDPQKRKKLFAALAMLLISSIMLVTVSYAWLALSVAPEVTGITTNVGANGSLEIALLTTETRMDMSTIRTGVGDSMAVSGAVYANTTWGNLIDLSDDSYGLDKMLLMPARLNATATGNGYVVDTGLLSIPTYGYDGRVIDVSEDSVSAIYKDSKFSYTLNSQDYGVRGIGTSSNLTAQDSALAMAKSNVVSFSNDANNALVSAFQENGSVLGDIIAGKALGTADSYDETQLNSLKGLVAKLQLSVEYIDLALRQGLVAVAASQIAETATFEAARDYIINTDNSLNTILTQHANIANQMPAAFKEWVNHLEDAKNDLVAAKTVLAELEGGSYTFEDFKPAVNYLMNLDKVYINDTPANDFSASDAGSLLGQEIVLTMYPGSGVPAQIADFTGNFETTMTMMGMNITAKSAITVDPAYLSALSAAIKDLDAADNNGGETAEAIELTQMYGYALDLAFRCNAVDPDLLLQTAPIQRVYEGSDSIHTLGGGSFMEFGSDDQLFTLDRVIDLMDAVRVGFLDNQGNLLGVAKLNISNRVVENNQVKAPLYLYDFSFSEEDGSMIMGERRKTDNYITDLDQNVAKAITVVVWLDGDLVDNSMVPADASTSLKGTLNLQFATSADLVPANSPQLMNLSADKTGLKAALANRAADLEAGQLHYSTVSWKAFEEAYTYATAVSENDNATQQQIYQASWFLADSFSELTPASTAVLKEAIEAARAITGSTENLARLGVQNPETGRYEAKDPYTMSDHEGAGKIYGVDYNKNLLDRGNGVQSRIYTDETWTALAAALYDAELLIMNPELTEAEIDEMLTALDTAMQGLRRNIYFVAYDYDGTLYFQAISEEFDADKDTYGRWYDKDRNLVVSDKTILDLDAFAQPATIAKIEQGSYVSNTNTLITPSVELLDQIYPFMAEEEILAIQWNTPALAGDQMTPEQQNSIAKLAAIAGEQGLSNLQAEANAMISTGTTAAKAQTMIETLLSQVGGGLSAEQKSTLEQYMEEAESLEASAIADQIGNILNLQEIVLAKDAQTVVDGINTALEPYRQGTVPATPTQLTLLEKALAEGGVAKTELEASIAENTASIEKVNEDLKKENLSEEEKTALNEQLTQLTAQKTELEARKTALEAEIKAVSDALAAGEGPTVKAANELLQKLNAQLTANGKEAVTEANTITHAIVNKDLFELTNSKYPVATMYLNGNVGQTEISAVILTKSGIVFTASKTINIYSPAESVEISEQNLQVEEKKTLDLSVHLTDREVQKLDEKYDPVMEDGKIVYVTVSNTETVLTASWSSDNMEILTVDDNGTVTGVAPGTATVSVLVETVQGNTYVDSVTITVTEAAQESATPADPVGE